MVPSVLDLFSHMSCKFIGMFFLTLRIRITCTGYLAKVARDHGRFTTSHLNIAYNDKHAHPGD